MKTTRLLLPAVLALILTALALAGEAPLASALHDIRQAGDRVAQNDPGVLYRDGRGVDRNLDEALRWFKRSADAGYPKAQLDLGLLLKAGTGAWGAP